MDTKILWTEKDESFILSPTSFEVDVRLTYRNGSLTPCDLIIPKKTFVSIAEGLLGVELFYRNKRGQIKSVKELQNPLLKLVV